MVTLSGEATERVLARYAVNELPVARLTMANAFGRFTSASSDVQEGNPIVISSSVDGGVTLFRVFSGSIVKKTSDLDANGVETLQVLCRDDRLSRVNVSFNNAVQKQRDIGQVFTGGVSASDGTTWSADANGNYPNGLLYQSGLTLSSTATDLYPYVPDVPLIVFPRESVFDAISLVAKTYGLDFYMTPTDSAFTVLRAKDDYPTLSGSRIALGENIHKSSLEFDNLRSHSGVLIVGRPPIFWFTGSTQSVYQLVDPNITSFEEAVERGNEWLRLNTTSLRRGEMTVPAYTHSILGRRISIEDDRHGWSGMGDVQAVEHDIRPEHWVTQLTIDNMPRSQERTLAEVLEDLKELKSEKEIVSVFNGFEYVSESDSRLSKSDSVLGNLAAIGIGTGGAGGLQPQGLIDIQPISARVTLSQGESLYSVSYANWGRNLPSSYEFTASGARLRELLFFKRIGDTDLRLQSKSYTFSRPTTLNDFTKSDAFENALQTYVVSVRSVVADGFSYFPKDGDVRFGLFAQGPNDGFLGPHVTASEWAASTILTLSDSERQSISWDAYQKTDGTWVASGSVPVGMRSAGIRWSVKTRLNESDFQDFDKLVMTAVCKFAFVSTKSSTPTGSVHWSMWTDEGLFGTGWNLGVANSPSAANQWATLSKTFSHADLEMIRLLREGSIYHKISPGIVASFDEELSASTPYTFSLAYWDFGIMRGNPNVIIEPGIVEQGARLRVSRPIKRVVGVHSKSDGSDDDILNIRGVERAGKKLVEPIIGFLPWKYPAIDNVLHMWGGVILSDDRRSLIADPPTDWNFRKAEIQVGNPSFSTFYVKYLPEDQALGQQDYTDAGGWALRRSPTGGTDSVKWFMDTSSDLRNRQNHPAYGMPYTIQYNVIRTAAEGDPLYARLTDSVGWDKTPEKTLTIAWREE